MKNLVAIIVLLISSYGMSQEKSLQAEASLEDFKIKGLSVSVDVDSAEEVESTFSIDDIEEILGGVAENEEISFEIICNGETMSDGEKSHMSYKVGGNSNDIEGFLKRVKKIRKAAIKYYKSK